MFEEDYILRQATLGLAALKERDVLIRPHRAYLHPWWREAPASGQRSNEVAPVRRSRSGSAKTKAERQQDFSDTEVPRNIYPDSAVKPRPSIDPLTAPLSPEEIKKYQRSSSQRARAKQKAATPASGSDRRMFHPAQAWAPPVDVYGKSAQIITGLNTHSRFRHATSVVPCIQRSVRREVIFATKQNRGHHTRKHRNWLSAIDC